jgi:hypothetical protein
MENSQLMQFSFIQTMFISQNPWSVDRYIKATADKFILIP